jgi:hypothetical protein
MAPILNRNNSEHRAIIESWFDAVCHDGGIDRFDDLHVDRVDETWKSRNAWFSSALESFEIALELRDAHIDMESLRIALAFSLKADTRPLGITFSDRESFEKDFCATPPSLYVLRPGMEFWKIVNVSGGTENARYYQCVKVPNAAELFGVIQRQVECCYLEFEAQDEFVRSLFLVG